jgi:hypothetical protein
MTKKVTQNVTNSNSEDLTEQWKKGELPRDEYFVKQENGKITKWELGGNGIPVKTKPKVEEVLAPVPSYEEYLSLTYAKEEDERIIAEYEAENTKLKELLKKCSELMDNTKVINIDFYMQRKKDVLNSINQVLGEE